jgi:hypothetical protein
VRNEAFLEKELTDQTVIVNQINRELTQYEIMKSELKTTEEMYQSFLNRSKEVAVAAGVNASNIRVVDRADVPAGPVRPNKRLNIALSVLMGTLFGVGLAFLRDYMDDTFKSTQDDRSHALALGEAFGSDLLVLNGTDRIFSEALGAGASGCITAMANLVSQDLRLVWDAHRAGGRDAAAQSRLDDARAISERFPPAAALIKDLLAEFHRFPSWPVKPPLSPLTPDRSARARLAWKTRGQIA